MDLKTFPINSLSLNWSSAENACEIKSLRNQNMSGKLWVVSNRLPMKISKSEEGKWNYSLSDGGLVTGLNGLKKEMSFGWIGYALAVRLLLYYALLHIFKTD
jgi:trehalose-6-phosphate synthase